MGIPTKLSLVSAMAILASVGSLQAADIIPEPVEPRVVELPPVEHAGGWYLRGDISMDWVDDFDATYATNTYTSSEIDRGFNFGIGAGYQFNEFFRADFTIERFSADFSGSTAGSCAFDGGGVIIAGSCSSVESADFSAWSTMANAYFDFGNFSGFTPYAGAGIGASYVSWDSYTSVETCTRTSVVTDACNTVGAANYVAPGTGAISSTSTITYAGDESWKFSYALMAGFSYDLTNQLKLDVGYKYTNIVSGAMINDIGGGISVDHSDLGIHAVRAGLRYMIW